MYRALKNKEKSVAVVGLGYVGLPVALAFAKYFRVIGFDIDPQRVELMRQGQDPSKEVDPEDFKNKDISFSSDAKDLGKANFFIVAVPTPVDEHRVPDLTSLKLASEIIGRELREGDYVVFESTVYPGCTEDECLPILERNSGMKVGFDFKLGYSPERISPGDKSRRLESIVKIVAGNDDEAVNEIAQVYSEVITAGVFKASSIKVAEAAKVIENAQRDLNISFVNELSIIFDKMNLDTNEVLEAAGTKWNFMKFRPGLVGGRCIGVDPYYLVHKARQLGYDPQVISSGRRINDAMPAFVAKKLVKLLLEKGKNPQESKVLVMGITFKENIADVRNSKVVDLIGELMQYSLHVHVTDPYASPHEVSRIYQLSLTDKVEHDYDAVLVAVGHDAYANFDAAYFTSIMKEDPVLMDLKTMYNFSDNGILIWRL